MPSMTLKSLCSSLGFDGQKPLASQMDARTLFLVCTAVLCILVPPDFTQLILALIGALAYAVFQAFCPKPRKTNCQLAAEREQALPARGVVQRPLRTKNAAARPRPNSPPSSPTVRKPEVYHPSCAPVSAPKFLSTGWDGEVNELISQIMPGTDEDKAVQRLVLHVKHTIQTVFPEVEVTGFAHASLKGGKAFGVAVPEVDIVASVNPHLLAQKFGRLSGANLLNKSAVRTCCDKLVAKGGLKFRRSAFRGEEPRVTLLVPASLGFFADAVPIDFSVNASTPFYMAALLTECGQIDPRAKELMLMVKRWAKDRGICHSSKGHFSPYMWSLLVMYFMQVGVEREGPLLPPLEDFAISSGLVKQPSSSKLASQSKPFSKAAAVDHCAKLSIGQLFKEFVHFYSQRFDWRNEGISVRLGQRGAPDLSLSPHLVPCEGSSAFDVAPTIEDPFKAGVNLGTCMNTMSLARLRQELTRAGQLCARTASLTELLEPWAPAGDKEYRFPAEHSSGSSPGEDDEQKPQRAKMES